MVWIFHGSHTVYGWNDPETFMFAVQLSKPVIKIECHSATAKPQWVLGGWVCRVLSDDLVPESQEHKVFLEQETAIYFLPIADFPLYRVRYRIPKWIEDVTVTLWEYQ